MSTTTMSPWPRNAKPVVWAVKPHAQDIIICHDARTALSVARKCMEGGDPVTITTTFRTDTPLGPVLHNVTAQY